MKTKYKTAVTRYRTKLRKAEAQKAIITSPYRLSEVEIKYLQTQLPELEGLEVQNIVDSSIIAGVVIRVGTRRIDLSLSSGLYSLKKHLYEHN